MKFRIGIIAFVFLAALIGVGVFLFLPKGGAKDGIYFRTYDGVYAKVTGSVAGNANSITLNDLTYGEGAAPTGADLSSWQVNLEFDDNDTITITINIENKATDSLYVIFRDNGAEINNVTKTIFNKGKEYTSGKVVLLQSTPDTTQFVITFRRDQDVATSIKYNYQIELKPELSASDIEDGFVELEESSGYTYIFNGNNTAVLTGMASGNDQTNLEIPNMVAKEGQLYLVTTIDDNAFKNKTTITSVIIPNTVTTLKKGVFEGCTSLTSVTIPTSVTRLGNRVFKGCTSLESVVLPNTITSIGTHLFSDCTKLEQFNIPTLITKLSDRMFENCEKLTEFTFPEQITTLGDYVFNGLSFETLTIPDTITSLTGNSFSGITNIGELTISCRVTKLAVTNDSLFSGISIDKATIITTDEQTEIGVAFYGANLLQSVEISDGVTSIGTNAFYGCSSLAEVEISNSVVTISSYAFQECVGLESFVIPNTVLTVGDWVFAGCVGLTELSIPRLGGCFGYLFGTRSYDGCVGVSQKSYSSGSLTTYYIPQSLTRVVVAGGNLSYGAFYNCSMLTNVVLSGTTASSIGECAFNNCNGLTSLTLNEGLTSIGLNAFNGCYGLTSIVIPETVTSINSRAFYGCSGLQSITVDSNNTIYDSRDNCNAIIKTETNTLVRGCANTQIPSTVTIIGEYAYAGCYYPNMGSVTIPDNVTSVQDYAYSGCSGITEFIVPNSVTHMGMGAFGCGGLVSITLPFIGSDAPETTPSYKSVLGYVVACGSGTSGTYIEEHFGTTSYSNTTFNTVPSTLRTVKVTGGNLLWGAFYGFSMITNVILDGVETIGDEAFNGCSNLQKITFSDSLTSISNYYVFSGCGNLNRVVTPSIESWLKVTFNSNPLSVAHNLYITDGTNETLVTDLVIPETDLEQNPITTIKSNAFNGCTSITSVTIPNSITTIGSDAFKNCTNISKVVTPSIESWLKISFTDANSNPLSVAHNLYTTDGTSETLITNLVVPENDLEQNPITSITKYAFCGCTSITKAVISANIETIGINVFKNCSALLGVFISSTVTTISASSASYSSFAGCASTLLLFTDVDSSNNKPANWGTYWNYVDSSTQLTVVWNTSSENMGEILSLATNYPEFTFQATKIVAYNGQGVTEVTVPELVTEIAGTTAVFRENQEIQIIHLPSTLTYIAANTFYGCSELTDINIPDGVTSIGSEAFRGCVKLENVTFGSNPGLQIIRESAFRGCSSLAGFDIPSTVTTIYQYAFSGCSSIQSITIPSATTTMGNYAFSGCSGMTNLDFDGVSQLTALGSTTFGNCSSLVKIIIPNSVTTIYNNVFKNCTGLTHVYIPSTVTTISASGATNSPFDGCSSTLKIYAGASSKPSGWSTYWNNYGSSNKLTVYWGISLEDYNAMFVLSEQYPDFTFAGRRVIKYEGTSENVTIPEGVTEIGTSAFNGKKDIITSVYIPSTVLKISATSYSNSPFYNCLSTLTIYTDVVDASSKPSGWGTYWNYYANGSSLNVVYNTSLEDYEAIINP